MFRRYSENTIVEYFNDPPSVQIHCVVESLKDKVISGAMHELSKWKSEKNLRKPIEIWTDVAFSVTGSLEEHISTAFSQVTGVVYKW